MNERHLTSEELDEVLIGAGLPADRAAHASTCATCRAGRDELLRLLTEARPSDPDGDVLSAVRRRALDAWERESTGHGQRRWWLAVAAVILLLVLLPMLRSPAPHPRASFDASSVLRDVDTVLDRDPLTAVASDAVVDTVAPADAGNGQGGA